MADQWYYQLFGSDFGPVEFDDVVRMLGTGELGPDDMVRPGADGSWVAVNSVSSLMTGATAVAVHSAEVADDIDSFMLVDETTAKPGVAATTETVADDGAFDIDSFRIVDEQKSAPPPQLAPKPAPQSDLAADLDNFDLMEEKKQAQKPAAPKKSAAAARSKEPVENLDDVNAAVWYFQGLDQELGPVPLSEIRAMVEARELGDRDLIRKGRKGQWVAVETVEEIFAEPPAPPVEMDAPATSAYASAVSAPAAAYAPASAATQYSQPLEYVPTPAPVPMPASWLLDVNWYCYINDQEFGPMSLADLQRGIAQGQMTQETYIKHTPQGEWTAASQNTDLFTPVAPPPPPVTPASLAPALAASLAPQGSNVADAERTELVQQLLTLLQQGVSAGSLSGSQIMAPTTGAGWFCNISGNVMGPVSIESLVKMVLQKRLFPDDLIRLGTTGEWFPAKTVPDLFPSSLGQSSARKSGVSDGQNVMERIDQMYRESQEAKAKAEAARAASPAAREPAPAASSKANPAGDVLKSMSANIARGAPAGSKSSGRSSGSSFSSSLSDLKLDGKTLGIAAAVVLIGVGIYFYPTLMGTVATKSAFTKLVSLQFKVKEAEESKTPANIWAPQAKDLIKEIDEISTSLKGSKTGSAQRDVSKMAKYLKEMIEAMGKPPAAGAGSDALTEFQRANKFYDESQKAAMKKLGLK